jgi:hypothetical protein
MIGSTSSASAKDGERNRNMQWHALASVVTTKSCIKILSSWLNEAKNSCVLPLLISSRRDWAGSTKRRSGCRISRACSRRHPDRALVHRAGRAKPAPVLERPGSTPCSTPHRERRRRSEQLLRLPLLRIDEVPEIVPIVLARIIPARVRRGGAGAGRSRRLERAPPRCDAVPRRCFPSERVRGLTRQYLRWSRRI